MRGSHAEPAGSRVLEMNKKVVERVESHSGLLQCNVKPLMLSQMLAMPYLVPQHGGGSLAHHEHWAKGRLSSSSELSYFIPTQGQKEKHLKVASLSIPSIR
ncbi:hypothetical protein ACH5RR_025790 [Cinchona calisaya]|uniref:Uncharacterized protein n=1 Tax=Cinchona calisaya TaxID=153742 RepID=A0ABD2Z0M7_9GENT